MSAPDVIDCPDCKGSGFVLGMWMPDGEQWASTADDCPACKGARVVPAWMARPPRRDGSGIPVGEFGPDPLENTRGTP